MDVTRILLLIVIKIKMPFYYCYSIKYSEYFYNGGSHRILSFYFTDNHIKQNYINLKLM